MKVLIVEDERPLRMMVRSCLESEGFTCTVAADGEEGLRKAKEQKPDVVLLDLGLPELDGIALCEQLRQTEATKDSLIMMVTGRDTEVDRIIGYSTGADDYLPKPFSPKELSVRLRAILRRSERQRFEQTVIETPHFLIDRDKREVLVQKDRAGDLELVSLTSLEFELLFLMASRPGRVWSRTELLDRTRGMDYVGDDRAIHTYMSRLRLKISPANQRDRFIRTITGVGYKFEDE